MAKKYVSTGGSFLEIEEKSKVFHLIWSTGERFSYVSSWTPDSGLDESDEDKKSTWEILVASAAAKPFSVREGSRGFEFESLEQARRALLAANASLLQGGFDCQREKDKTPGGMSFSAQGKHASAMSDAERREAECFFAAKAIESVLQSWGPGWDYLGLEMREACLVLAIVQIMCGKNWSSQRGLPCQRGVGWSAEDCWRVLETCESFDDPNRGLDHFRLSILLRSLQHAEQK